MHCSHCSPGRGIWHLGGSRAGYTQHFATTSHVLQEKYKKRKAKKHIATVTVRRPTARLLSEAYFEKVG
jgi:hypothetical protein